MRILLLTQWCEPEPTFKGRIFARELKKRGHEVEILTGFPNYPGGKLYQGYRVKPYQRGVVDGITVHRVPLYPSHDKSALRRIANYASFALTAAVLGPLVVKRPDIIYAYHPPPTIGLPAIALKRLFKVPLVYDIQDMWPDTVRVSGMLTNEMAIGVIDHWCKLIYREADRIVVLSPGFKRLLEERDVPCEKISVIFNWTHESGEPLEPNPEVAEQLVFTGRFNVLFAGTMGTAQALDTVLDAAKLLAARKPEVQFLFVGGGVDRERLEKRTEDEKISNVCFLPRQESTAMGPILAAADVLLVHLKDDPLFRITIPSKTQAYLAAGKPILMGVHGDAASLIEEAGCGLVFPPQNSEALADAIEGLAEMPAESRKELGRRGRRFYDERVSLSAGCTAFERVFESVVKRRTDSPTEASKKMGDACPCRRTSTGRRTVQDTLQRGMDVATAGSLLVVLSPFLAGVALAIRATMGSPVLFRQRRPGLRSEPLDLFKFRTMTDGRGAEGELLPDTERLTDFGRWLRSTSLDELPELWNVIRGELSLVGPRPLLMQYLERYTPEQARRHEVKPGITGWAQVNGRNAISWEEKFKLDVWYVDHQSLLLDLKILGMTALKVLRREGVSALGEATMPEFIGEPSVG